MGSRKFWPRWSPLTPPKSQDSVVSFQVFFILTVLNKCSLPNCRVQYDCRGNSKLLQLIMHYTAGGESIFDTHIYTLYMCINILWQNKSVFHFSLLLHKSLKPHSTCTWVLVSKCQNPTPQHIMQKYIQLFRQRLSYKNVKVNTAMSNIIMGNNGFAPDWLKPKVFWRQGRKQHKQV